MDDTLYLVTCDGYTSGYGCEIYLVGIFINLEEAQAAKDTVNSNINNVLRNKWDGWYDNHYCQIIIAEKDTIYPMRCDNWDCFTNDKYIGGYVE